MAYHLAAAQGPEIEKYLENTVILFDPSFNPDGLTRFSTWANSRKSKLISPDPNDMEHNETWPGGRFNHCWLDLNRDWLVCQMPESQGRIKKNLQWKPNVLTVHHEQGTNATFFFMPGEPTRVHPLTPDKNQELARKMGVYHAKALDQIASLYFTQGGYDDFIMAKVLPIRMRLEPLEFFSSKQVREAIHRKAPWNSQISHYHPQPLRNDAQLAESRK